MLASSRRRIEKRAVSLLARAGQHTKQLLLPSSLPLLPHSTQLTPSSFDVPSYSYISSSNLNHYSTIPISTPSFTRHFSSSSSPSPAVASSTPTPTLTPTPTPSTEYVPPITAPGVAHLYPEHAAQHDRSIKDPVSFWYEQSKYVEWFTPPSIDNTLDITDPTMPLWFKDGEMNLSYACLDANVYKKGRGDQVAVIYDNAYSNTTTSYTYKQVLKEVERIAGGLRAEGVRKGDRVVLYMPMIPETMFTMLACARIGKGVYIYMYIYIVLI